MLDHHGSAVHMQGMRIIIFGAGAHDNLHSEDDREDNQYDWHFSWL